MGSCVIVMVKAYFHVFLDVDNPDGDEIAFECEDDRTIDTIVTFLKYRTKAVCPE